MIRTHHKEKIAYLQQFETFLSEKIQKLSDQQYEKIKNKRYYRNIINYLTDNYYEWSDDSHVASTSDFEQYDAQTDAEATSRRRCEESGSWTVDYIRLE